MQMLTKTGKSAHKSPFYGEMNSAKAEETGDVPEVYFKYDACADFRKIPPAPFERGFFLLRALFLLVLATNLFSSNRYVTWAVACAIQQAIDFSNAG